MMDKLKTYGEFIAAVEETQCIYAQTFLEEWKALATEEKWQKIRPMPLTKELVLAFAEDMANYFRETISSTCGEELYAEEKESGHAFLREICTKAVALGIDVKIEEIDTFLTMTDLLIAKGYAKVVPNEE